MCISSASVVTSEQLDSRWVGHWIGQNFVALHMLILLLLRPLLVQGSTADEKADEKAERSADGDEDETRAEQNKPESYKMEEGCGKLPAHFRYI